MKFYYEQVIRIPLFTHEKQADEDLHDHEIWKRSLRKNDYQWFVFAIISVNVIVQEKTYLVLLPRKMNLRLKIFFDILLMILVKLG